MPSGSVTLGQIAGQFLAARLIAEHGQQLPVPELRQTIAAHCPRMIEGKISDLCGVHFPGSAG